MGVTCRQQEYDQEPVLKWLSANVARLTEMLDEWFADGDSPEDEDYLDVTDDDEEQDDEATELQEYEDLLSPTQPWSS